MEAVLESSRIDVEIIASRKKLESFLLLLCAHRAEGKRMYIRVSRKIRGSPFNFRVLDSRKRVAEKVDYPAFSHSFTSFSFSAKISRRNNRVEIHTSSVVE